MNRFFKLPILLLLAASLILVNACTTDDEAFVIPPSISLGSGADFISSDATIGVGTPIRVNLIATKGDNPMNVIEFLQDGSRISDISRIEIDGAPASSNAPLLGGADADAVDWDVSIVPHADGTSTYTFSVSDAEGHSDQVSIDITIQAASPSLSFEGEGSNVIVTTDLYEVKVTVATNGVELSTISVSQDGNLITEMDKIYYGDVMTEFAPNPLDLTGDDVNGLTEQSIFIRVQDMGTAEYTIEVTNTAGLTDSKSITLTRGTPINAEYTGVLLANADGPNPTGGMDLYTGSTVSVFSGDADVIDSGIDGNGDWLQQIEPANGATMRELSQAQIDGGFSFVDIGFKEEIIDTWSGADDVTNPGVGIGDVFIINKDDDYFIIQCVLIETTPSDNEDKYEFDIKQAIF